MYTLFFSPTPHSEELRMLHFACLVYDDAKWDLKNDNPWINMFHDNDPPEYLIFHGMVLSREELGNLTYGILGSACGYPQNLLFYGGGFANNFHGDISDLVPAIIKPLLDRRTWGDTYEDHFYIQEGIDIWYHGYY